MSKLAFTNEIGSSFLSSSASYDIEALLEDPQSYLHSRFDLDFSGTDLHVAKNEGDVINLALPYYSGLDSVSASPQSDISMEDVSGGEIFITLAVLSGLALAGATAAAIGTIVPPLLEEKKEGEGDGGATGK